MKAMILAAGLGTRLRPLTDNIPKALVPVMNRPMIAWMIDYLKGYGVSEIVVNGHHQGRMLLEYLGDGSSFGVRIVGSFEPEILGTGGGLREVADFWGDEPFVVANADILTDIDLSAAIEAHERARAIATLILHHRPNYSKVLLDSEGRIKDISRDVIPGRLAFTGIHVIEPSVLEFIKPGVFSDIIDCYRGLIKEGRLPLGFVSEGHTWHDIGTVKGYLKAHEELCLERHDPVLAEEDCAIDPHARLIGWAALGSRVVVERCAVVERSVLWDNVRVRAGVRVIGSVARSGAEIKRDLIGGVI